MKDTRRLSENLLCLKYVNSSSSFLASKVLAIKQLCS